MKILALLIVFAGSTFIARAYVPVTCPGPTFVFYGDQPNRCNGVVNLSIAACPGTVTGTYSVDYVEWTLTGTGPLGTANLTVTTSSLELEYTYQVGGIKTATATVYCTVNGVQCSTTALHTNTADPTVPNLCTAALTSSSPNLILYVSVFTQSLYVADPVPPTQIYSNTQVDIGVSQVAGSLINPSYKVYIDGVQYGSTVNAAPPAILLNNYIFSTGQHLVELAIEDKGILCNFNTSIMLEVLDSSEIAPCATCFTFRPLPNERYWFSAWVKADVATATKSYQDLGMYAQLSYTGNSSIVNIYPEGEIIDGWQRIAGEFTVPNSPAPSEIKINMVNDNATTVAYFDDVRVHPFNASMKSYVNDASTFWLVAELDDNNFATFYEYDKEGKLIRIKKETERGIMTIQESRTSNPKTN